MTVTWIVVPGLAETPEEFGRVVELLSDEDVLVRQSAANALGLLGHPDALEPLREAVRKERWYDRRRHKQAIRKIEDVQKLLKDLRKSLSK